MNSFRCLRAFVVLAAVSTTGLAKDKKPKTPPKDPQDQITVVGHIPVTSGPVRRFLATQHYSSFYLYAEHDAGKGVTLIDVTKISLPSVVANISYPTDSVSLFSVAGTSVLVTDSQGGSAAAPLPPQTIRIFDLSDPLHVKVAREFKDVTAISRDERRGLIFVANGDGVWILHQELATDPEVEKEYERYIMYNR